MHSIEFDVVPMTVCHLLLGRPWLYDRSVQHNGRANTYHLEFKGKMINLHPMTPHQIATESRQKTEAHTEPSLVRDSDIDVVPQHNMCYLLQPMLIGDRGASRSTPFEEGGDDEDIPDQDTDPGGQVQVRGEEDVQKDFGRPTRFGRPTSMEKMMSSRYRDLRKRRTSVQVRTSDMTDVRTLTDVRQM